MIIKTRGSMHLVRVQVYLSCKPAVVWTAAVYFYVNCDHTGLRETRSLGKPFEMVS